MQKNYLLEFDKSASDFPSLDVLELDFPLEFLSASDFPSAVLSASDFPSLAFDEGVEATGLAVAELESADLGLFSTLAEQLIKTTEKVKMIVKVNNFFMFLFSVSMSDEIFY